MANLEKLVKAFETLKVFQPGAPVEDAATITKLVDRQTLDLICNCLELFFVTRAALI